jgi:hypothetical protein
MWKLVELRQHFMTVSDERDNGKMSQLRIQSAVVTRGNFAKGKGQE